MPGQRPLNQDYGNRWRSCDNKKAYRSKQEAEQTRFALYGIRAYEYRSYQCEFCRRWHLGHPKQN